jgi:hypothetical protein
MTVCSWCGAPFDIALVFHICDDGTTFPERMRKTHAEISEQRARRERWALARKEMGVAPSGHIVRAKEGVLPEQPNTAGETFRWTSEDLELAKKLKIKL